jgi:hypothetical protein
MKLRKYGFVLVGKLPSGRFFPNDGANLEVITARSLPSPAYPVRATHESLRALLAPTNDAPTRVPRRRQS